MKLYSPSGTGSTRPANCHRLGAIALFCFAATTFLPAQTLISIAITPTNPSLAAGTTLQLSATGTFDDGSTQDITNIVTWSTLDSTIATVNSQGLLSGVGVGQTDVFASAGGIVGLATVTVNPAVLMSIAVTPAIPSIPLGTTQQFTATGTFSDNSTQNITATVQWSSSSTAVATISNGPNNIGLATPASVGTTTITAAAPGGISGNTTLTVTPAVVVSISLAPANPSIALGTTEQFTATGTYTDSHTQDLTSVATWTSDTPSTATVNQSGLAISVGTGTATISASSGGVTGSTILTVTPAVVVSITISPNQATIPLGNTQPFTATATYSDGTMKDVTQTGHWTSTESNVATISNAKNTAGVATSKGLGTTTIGISLDRVSATAALTVSAAALVSIAISPSAPSIPLGQTQQFTATGAYTDGSTKDITSVVTWVSSSANVAIISNASGNNGLATSAGAGTTNISATQGNISSSTTLTVTAPELVSIAIAPLNASISLGTTQQFTATGTYTNNSTQDLTNSVTWSSDPSGVASITAGGLATATTLGTTDITAASGNITASTNLTVIAPPPPSCSLQVSPASGSAPLKVSATATCTSHSANAIATTIVSFGDGFYQSSSMSTHTFVAAGSFTVTVVATDTAGNSSSVVSQTVSVANTASFFVGVSNGQIEQFSSTGTLLKTLNTGLGGSVTGMGFDALGALYVTDFTADTVSRFDGSGKLIGNFGSGYNCKPESIVFDNAGNAYVGETGCSHALLKFDAYGNLVHGWAVTTEVEGSDWIDLASDQCTIFYTSQGTSILRFNVCTGEQLPVFATGLHTGLGLRVLPDGGVLVADDQDIMRFDSAGRNVSTYTATGENCWVSVTLDPDGKSFWAVDFCTSDILHFDLTAGNQLGKFNSGTPTQTVYGIAMQGAPTKTTAAGPFIAAQQSTAVSAGQKASFAVSFNPSSGAINQTFSFSCTDLPLGASCAFTPQTVVATSSGIPAIDATVSTTGVTASLGPSRFARARIFALFFFLPAVVLLADVRNGKRKRLALTLSAVLVLLGLIVACGGASSSSSSNSSPTPSPPNPSSSATPAGTYSIVITATSNSLVSSTVVTLTVH
ncbi:MAG TPA: Ig-like domain-containing protein [Terriglobales bacterium]|nr:Ig-like domain-containing protein [Terriglobales bacterium]